MLEFLVILTATAPSLGTPSEIWAAIVHDFANIGSTAAMSAFGQVVLIDLVFAADNAIVVGALAGGLPTEQRRKVILIGIGAALVLRIFFALIVVQLLQIVGLVLAGGLLLLWVAWNFYREIFHEGESSGSPEVKGDEHSGVKSTKTFWGAVWAVTAADVSMSLDNVLGVAGAAREHPGILVVGLLLSVALMGLAANVIAKYIERYKWIAYLGLAVIVYVAGKMIYSGLMGDGQTIGVLTLFG
ncbi:Putative transmembrane protein [hydrothermal vent metagenome]|uniref:Transmembrane protein n=1 Tax=hydrothermal vent metagenome TaxID=652676 RepID=A0A3B0SD69_9ZZZZ